jgi:hypothetical protein
LLQEIGGEAIPAMLIHDRLDVLDQYTFSDGLQSFLIDIRELY